MSVNSKRNTEIGCTETFCAMAGRRAVWSQPHREPEFLGDYFAVAIAESCIGLWENGKPPFKGQHAGLCAEEMMIPVIVVSNEDSE
ncbi:MAG: hypothetical protein ACLSA6_17755 [Holdemania massiliensis]